MLWWFIVFTKMLTSKSLFMPHRLPILSCIFHPGLELSAKKILADSPEFSLQESFQLTDYVCLFLTLWQIALCFCTGCAALLEPLSGKQSKLSFRHITCINFTASNMYLSKTTFCFVNINICMFLPCTNYHLIIFFPRSWLSHILRSHGSTMFVFSTAHVYYHLNTESL